MMRYPGRLVWKHIDGSIEVTGPGEPVQGIYEVGSLRHSVASLGDGRTAISAQMILELDLLVAQDKATFVAAENETQYFTRIARRTRAAVPRLADVPFEITSLSEAAHKATDRTFRDAWTWTSPEPVIDVDISKARQIQASRIEKAKRIKAGELLERQMLGENISAEQALLQGIDADQLVSGATTISQLKAAWPAELPSS